MFDLRERTERDMCEARNIVSNTPHEVVVYYYYNGWLQD
jgi:hypothetical protein